MRYLIIGAGGVGGTIGARLHQLGRPVILVARGAHGAALKSDGLRFVSPAEEVVLSIPTVTDPSELRITDEDRVLLCVKSQQTVAALGALRAAAGPAEPAVICAQNGVSNEEMALRRFTRVYAMLVQLPATHLTPGEVVTEAADPGGVLDTGCYPGGVDDCCTELCADLTDAGFVAAADPRVMRKKYAKLLTNLGNAPQALLSESDQNAEGARRLRRALVKEALACYAAAGIDCADRDAVQSQIQQIGYRELPGRARQGGSSWQSLARGTGDIEADYLNGEIARLGRLHGVPTPANALCQRLAFAAARSGAAPGSVPLSDLLSSVLSEA